MFKPGDKIRIARSILQPPCEHLIGKIGKVEEITMGASLWNDLTRIKISIDNMLTGGYFSPGELEPVEHIEQVDNKPLPLPG